MDATPQSNDRFAVAWALEDAEQPAVEVIDLTDARHEAREDAHCPACLSTHVDTAVTPGGDRYDRCLGCSRLWEVRDGTRRLVIPAHGHRPGYANM